MKWKLFTCSELYEPWPCEIEGCPRGAWTIRLTMAEYESLHDKSGSHAVHEINNRRLGTAVCADCAGEVSAKQGGKL